MTTLRIEGPDGKTYRVEGEGDPETLAKNFSTQMWPNIAGDTGLKAAGNTLRIAGTGALQGVGNVGDEAKRLLGPPPGGMLFRPGEQWMGAGGTKPLQALGLPTDPNAEAKRLGVPMTPNRQSLASGAKIAAEVATMGGRALPSAITGAFGAAGHAVGGEPGATAAALLGPLGVLGGARALGNRAAAAANKPPTTQQLYNQADNAFADMRAAGAVVDAPALQNFKARIDADLTRQGFRPALDPATKTVLSELEKDIAKGTLSFDELHGFRRVINKGMEQAKPGGSDARLLSRMKSKLDDFLTNMTPAQVVAGDPARAAAALKEATRSYRKAATADEIEALVTKAKNNAPGFAQVGLDKALRDQFKQIANSPRRMRLFTPEEQAQIQKIARGTKATNLLRFFGGMSPKGALTGMAHGANILANPALGLPIAGALSAARMGAKSARVADVKKLDELVRRGAPAPASRPFSKTDEMLLRAVLFGGAASAY